MASPDSVLSSFPPRPIRIATLAEIAGHDRIVVALSLLSRGAVEANVAKTVMLQTTAVGVVAEYAGEGWLVTKQVRADDPTEEELFEALVDATIDVQQEADGLLSAVLPDGRRVDVRDLLDVHPDRLA